jgi:ribosomal protein L11 methyltransferase
MKNGRKTFEAIDVDGNCHVRAPFHQRLMPGDIIIEPKMSFGTGHHETTHMMIQHLLEMDVSGTLDMELRNCHSCYSS